jgi:hypothetical protein
MRTAGASDRFARVRSILRDQTLVVSGWQRCLFLLESDGKRRNLETAVATRRRRHSDDSPRWSGTRRIIRWSMALLRQKRSEGNLAAACGLREFRGSAYGQIVLGPMNELLTYSWTLTPSELPFFARTKRPGLRYPRL